MVGGYSGRFSSAPGAHVITATYGNPNYNPACTTSVTIGGPDFTVTSSETALHVNAGASGETTLSLSPVLGYSANVMLVCSGGLPAGATCAISPASVSLSTAQTATIIVATLAPSPNVSAAVQQGAGWRTVGGVAWQVCWLSASRAATGCQLCCRPCLQFCFHSQVVLEETNPKLRRLRPRC